VHWGSPIILRIEQEKNELLSYGDFLKTGTYRLHSSFGEAVNYFSGNRLISLVSKETGNGPFNIVLNKVKKIKSESLEVSVHFIKINGTDYYLSKAKSYNSSILFSSVDIDAFCKNLSIATEIVKKDSPKKSYAFLIDDTRKKSFNSSFEKSLLERVLKGWSLIEEKHYIDGTAMLKGTGYGFTPSGDDFLAGLLTGLYLKSRIEKNTNLIKAVENVRKLICRTGRTGNIISDNFLLCAYMGRFYERTKNLILSLLSKDENAVKDDTYRMIRHGETSGADFTTGMICALTRMH
jgi:hypothetical protein